MKANYLFIAIMISVSSTVYSQITDSLAVSYDQANEIANGLINEGRLRDAFNSLSAENDKLLASYQSSNKVLTSYRDSLVPSLREVISLKDQESGVKDRQVGIITAELKHEKKRKWKYAVISLLIGFASGVVIAGY
jgi:hypothetical protein